MKNDETMPKRFIVKQGEKYKFHIIDTDANNLIIAICQNRYAAEQIITSLNADRPDPELAEVKKSLMVLMNLYRDDISKAIEIMAELGRNCDPAETMIEHTELRSGYYEALAILDRKIGGA